MNLISKGSKKAKSTIDNALGLFTTARKKLNEGIVTAKDAFKVNAEKINELSSENGELTAMISQSEIVIDNIDNILGVKKNSETLPEENGGIDSSDK